ncbi:MAG: ABC transporter ATP-binding protein/permease, partial [Streptomyces sp.]|nr:ABC transporter ATP-binding protein/permease [Streptomyces sp.]
MTAVSVLAAATDPNQTVLNGALLVALPVALLGGLYRPWQGRVRVGGSDPAAVPEDLRRRAIAVVPQNLHLFSGTLRDNVTFGDETISDEDVARAVALAQLKPVLESLPEGDKTV